MSTGGCQGPSLVWMMDVDGALIKFLAPYIFPNEPNESLWLTSK